MGCFEYDKDLLKIYCHERPEDKGNFWECDITKEEVKLLETNKVSMFTMMNDGRKVY